MHKILILNWGKMLKQNCIGKILKIQEINFTRDTDILTYRKLKLKIMFFDVIRAVKIHGDDEALPPPNYKLRPFRQRRQFVLVSVMTL